MDLENRKTRDRELSSGFLRQGRNLFFVSVLMPLFFISGAEIQSMNFFGSSILIEDQLGFEILIVVLFAYSALRFWQYYKEENHTSEIMPELLKSMHAGEILYLKRLADTKADIFELKHRYYSFHKENYRLGYQGIQRRDDAAVSWFKKKTYIYLQAAEPKYEKHYLGREYQIDPISPEKILEIEKQWR